MRAHLGILEHIVRGAHAWRSTDQPRRVVCADCGTTIRSFEGELGAPSYATYTTHDDISLHPGPNGELPGCDGPRPVAATMMTIDNDS